MSPDPIRAIAQAVLYEGYVLWPYRRSSLKNQQRWTFGGVFPPAQTARAADDPCAMQTECLLQGDASTQLEVRVRFLQVVQRQVMAAGPHGLQPVEELAVGEERHLTWEEAVEREVVIDTLRLDALSEPVCAQVDFVAGEQREDILDANGAWAGAVVRDWRGLVGAVELSAEEVAPGLHKLSVRIENATPWAGAQREEALRLTYCSTHTVLRAVSGGAFVSLTDPPEDLRGAAGACCNVGTWPVLVGEPGGRSALLSSPIILSDYPEIAPESPGDLFDGGEIDQMLVLNILSLTDEEKREMRASDPKTREILERTEALTDAEMLRLNGAIREFGLARTR